jgi:hypothetical protein
MAHLRLPVLALLLTLVAALARADGFAFGEHFLTLRETDQVAVIHLAPNHVTVDMYIAIDGIPKGETVTYVLPFWTKPEGFTLEEFIGNKYDENPFFTDYIKPARERVLQESRRPGEELLAQAGVTVGVGAFSIGFCPPLIIPMTLGGSGDFSPYQQVTTPSARAELYHVDAADLPALLAQAGLPVKYADALKRYNTPYFAIMRLTGAAGSAVDKFSIHPRGVHYHFTHATPGADYIYTYPLGTGAAWPNPILLTEVYATSDKGSELHATAPTIGELTPYKKLASRVMMHSSKDVGPLTATLATHLPRCPTAWHIAYLNSNPNEDITLHLQPSRHNRWDNIYVAFRDRVLPFFLIALALACAWALAYLVIVFPSWRKALIVGNGFPDISERYVVGTLWRYVTLAILRTTFWSLLFIGLCLIVLALAGMSQSAPSTIDHLFLYGSSALLAVVAIFFTVRHLDGPRARLYPVLTRSNLFGFYLLAMVGYYLCWWLATLLVGVL